MPTTLKQDYWPVWNSPMVTTGSALTIAWENWNVAAQEQTLLTGQQTWLQWNILATANTTTSYVQTGTIWGNWNTDFVQTGAMAYQPAPYQPFPAPVETEEQRAERQRQAEIRARQARRDALKREKERLASIRRARTLLRGILTGKEWTQWKKEARVDIIAESGKPYRIYRGSHGNVAMLDEQGREIESFCIGPADYGGIPDEDVVASQILMLQTNEARFRQIANIRNIRNLEAYRQARQERARVA